MLWPKSEGEDDTRHEGEGVDKLRHEGGALSEDNLVDKYVVVKGLSTQ